MFHRSTKRLRLAPLLCIHIICISTGERRTSRQEIPRHFSFVGRVAPRQGRVGRSSLPPLLPACPLPRKAKSFAGRRMQRQQVPRTLFTRLPLRVSRDTIEKGEILHDQHHQLSSCSSHSFNFFGLSKRWFHATRATRIKQPELRTQLRKDVDEGYTKMKDRYLIFGLGNPGKEYVKTRHNIGSRAVEELGKSLGVSLTKTRCNCKYDQTYIQTKTVYLAQPQTYMNQSGR